MNYEILDALSQITREKSVERQNLIETLEAGLISAGRKKFGPTANIQVVFDNATGGISLWRVLDVVEAVEDPVAQIALSEAQVIDPQLEAGSQLRYPLSLEEFGRNAIQAAKQVFIQRVREAERERIFQEFADKVGTLVRGVVQQVDRGNVIVKLERCEGFLPAREQIPRDHHRQNDYVRAIVLNVDKMARGPQVILSRTHPDFLRRLFEAEVPEIAERIVEIKAVAREAGGRSKISVYSHDPRVDAVGSCVGLKGSRVQSIVRELGGERIDIVPWSSDAGIFVSRALSPAKVLDVRVIEAERRCQVVVADDQLSLAIGKGGQNARLAAKLTGWKIDLISKSEDLKRQEAERALLIPIAEMQGLGPKLIEKLLAADIETVQELAASKVDDLTEIEGVGEKTAEKVLEAARRWLELHPPQPPAEVEFTPEMEKDEAMAAVAALETAVAAHPIDEEPVEMVEIEDLPETDYTIVPEMPAPAAEDEEEEAAEPAAPEAREAESEEEAPAPAKREEGVE
jgi:N utilization substance protein A